MLNRLYSGKIYCTTCHQEGDPMKVPGWNLYRQKDGSYAGYCSAHTPEKDETTEELALLQTSLHFEWRLVEKLVIHQPDNTTFDRRGPIITVVMREIQNRELMTPVSIEICQALIIMSSNSSIHQPGECGEQCNCWVEPNYFWENPATCTIRDKYWGDQQIKNLQEVCRTMSRIHKWELEDETKSPLDRIVDALDESEA